MSKKEFSTMRYPRGFLEDLKEGIFDNEVPERLSRRGILSHHLGHARWIGAAEHQGTLSRSSSQQ